MAPVLTEFGERFLEAMKRLNVTATLTPEDVEQIKRRALESVPATS